MKAKLGWVCFFCIAFSLVFHSTKAADKVDRIEMEKLGEAYSKELTAVFGDADRAVVQIGRYKPGTQEFEREKVKVAEPKLAVLNKKYAKYLEWLNSDEMNLEDAEEHVSIFLPKDHQERFFDQYGKFELIVVKRLIENRGDIQRTVSTKAWAQVSEHLDEGNLIAELKRELWLNRVEEPSWEELQKQIPDFKKHGGQKRMLLRRAIFVKASLNSFDVDKDVLALCKDPTEPIRAACVLYLRRGQLRGKECENTLLSMVEETQAQVEGHEAELATEMLTSEVWPKKLIEKYPHLESSVCAAMLLTSFASDPSKAKAKEFLLSLDVAKPKVKRADGWEPPKDEAMSQTLLETLIQGPDPKKDLAAVREFMCDLKATGKKANALAGKAVDAILKVRP